MTGNASGEFRADAEDGFGSINVHAIKLTVQPQYEIQRLF